MKLSRYNSVLVGAVLVAMLAMVTGCGSDSDDDDDTVIEKVEDDGDDDAVQETIDPVTGLSEFVVPLSAELQAPPLDLSEPTGEALLTIDKSAGLISGTLNVSGLTSAVTNVAIMKGFAGINGERILELLGNADGSVWTLPENGFLDASALFNLVKGELYINVATVDNPAGEIRGQIVPIGILLEDSELSGEEQVPPVNTLASAIGFSTVNEVTGAISATIFTEGLVDVSMVHIHFGEAGLNDDVIITMSQDPDDDSIWRTPLGVNLTAEQVENFTKEWLYFNVQTANFPDGEIRGQL